MPWLKKAGNTAPGCDEIMYKMQRIIQDINRDMFQIGVPLHYEKVDKFMSNIDKLVELRKEYLKIEDEYFADQQAEMHAEQAQSATYDR